MTTVYELVAIKEKHTHRKISHTHTHLQPWVIKNYLPFQGPGIVLGTGLSSENKIILTLVAIISFDTKAFIPF